QSAAGAVTADRDMPGGNSVLAQETPRRKRIVERGGKRVLRRQSIADRERVDTRRAPGLGHHAAMAHDRAGAIAAAVEAHPSPRRIAGGNGRPFAWHAIAID